MKSIFSAIKRLLLPELTYCPECDIATDPRPVERVPETEVKSTDIKTCDNCAVLYTDSGILSTNR